MLPIVKYLKHLGTFAPLPPLQTIYNVRINVIIKYVLLQFHYKWYCGPHKWSGHWWYTVANSKVFDTFRPICHSTSTFAYSVLLQMILHTSCSCMVSVHGNNWLHISQWNFRFVFLSSWDILTCSCRVIEHEKRWLHTSHQNWDIVSWWSVSACCLTCFIHGNLFSHTLHGHGECFYSICLPNSSTHETLLPHTSHGNVSSSSKGILDGCDIWGVVPSYDTSDTVCCSHNTWHPQQIHLYALTPPV